MVFNKFLRLSRISNLNFFNNTFQPIIISLLLVLLLSACGSGGGSNVFSSSLSTDPQSSATAAEACVMWSYDTSAVPNLAGFRIYDGAGNLLYETTNTDSMHVDFLVTMTADQMTFTMTAFDADGNESAHSAPYTVARG